MNGSLLECDWDGSVIRHRNQIIPVNRSMESESNAERMPSIVKLIEVQNECLPPRRSA